MQWGNYGPTSFEFGGRPEYSVGPKGVADPSLRSRWSKTGRFRPLAYFDRRMQMRAERSHSPSIMCLGSIADAPGLVRFRIMQSLPNPSGDFPRWAANGTNELY